MSDGCTLGSSHESSGLPTHPPCTNKAFNNTNPLKRKLGSHLWAIFPFLFIPSGNVHVDIDASIYLYMKIVEVVKPPLSFKEKGTARSQTRRLYSSYVFELLEVVASVTNRDNMEIEAGRVCALFWIWERH